MTYAVWNGCTPQWLKSIIARLRRTALRLDENAQVAVLATDFCVPKRFSKLHP
jgi:hypothetical protein